MAVLNKKEQKIQAVLGRLPKKYTDVQFTEMFIKLYSKDWGKIKSAYIKQNQDREPGAAGNMPKPDLYLKQLLTIYLNQQGTAIVEPKSEEIEDISIEKTEKETVAKVAKPKASVKKVKEVVEGTEEEAPAKPKKVTKKAVKASEVAVEEVEVVKKKAPAKPKVSKTVKEEKI